MSEQSRVVAASVAGAAIGAVIGFLYMTERGRQMRVQFEPRLDDFSQEIRRLRTTITKAQEVANEGWRSLNELIGERGRTREWSGQPREGQPRASSY